jgi:hypothetical protein
MNIKNILVWVAGAVLAVSFVWPQLPESAPSAPPVATPDAETDSEIVATLKSATAADKRRIVGVYSGLVTVLKRDAGQRVKNTEQWAELQARTLELAIDEPGKYPGLDRQIEAVFLRCVGTDDVVPANAETQQKLIRAAEMVANSAAR